MIAKETFCSKVDSLVIILIMMQIKTNKCNSLKVVFLK